MIRPPPTSPLFPYTTLFRSYLNVSVMMTLSGVVGVNEKRFRTLTEEVFGRLPDDLEIPPVRAHRRYLKIIRQPAEDLLRSEEHTSELQSPVHIVCRLLLEKK